MLLCMEKDASLIFHVLSSLSSVINSTASAFVVLFVCVQIGMEFPQALY